MFSKWKKEIEREDFVQYRNKKDIRKIIIIKETKVTKKGTPLFEVKKIQHSTYKSKILLLGKNLTKKKAKKLAMNYMKKSKR